MWKRFLVLFLGLGLIWPILTTRAATPLATAISYLQNNYPAQTAGNQDWAATALGENGASVTPAATDTSSLISTERSVLARAAQGAERSSQVTQIENSFSADQFGSPSLINDDIFGVLAVQSSDPSWLNSRQGVFTTIAASQRADGSFGFSKTGAGDGDITAAAIWALNLAANRPTAALNNAAAFLKNCQNSDGGFGVEPGQTSSVATSAWAMIAQNTLGQDSSGVRNYLFTNEQSGGFWLQGTSANYLNTAYAVMALSGKKLPFVRPATPPPAAGGDQTPTRSIQPPANSTNPATKNAPAATPKSGSAAPASSSSPSAAIAKPAAKKIVRRRVVRTTTVTTYQTITCSASASASAGDGYATASASASCQ